jgi:dethiobiotin synthetase
LTNHIWNRPLNGLFVTGTDTGVGKTVLASAIAAALAERGERVGVFKPALTGTDEPDGPPDDVMLAASAHSQQMRGEVTPYRFGPPVSPHLAATLAGTRIERSVLLERARRAFERASFLVAEGVGGILVPLCDDYLVRDFARDLGLPVIIAARPDLGTINHCLLTVTEARNAGLDVLAVVFTPWPEEPSEIERSNLETVARFAEVEVATLGPVYTGPPVSPACDLPLDRWLPRPSPVPAEALTRG